MARPPRAPRAPALLDARGLWMPAMPAADGTWRLRGASLAVWGGEVVCVAGTDAAALRALLACLRGAVPWGGVVRARPAWWRTGRTAGPLDVRGRDPARIVQALRGATRRSPGSALVLALVVEDRPQGWSALGAAVAAGARSVPIRCVALVAGRVVPPPFR